MQISGAWLLPCLHVLLLFLCTSFVALLGSIVTSYHLSPRGAVLACHVGVTVFAPALALAPALSRALGPAFALALATIRVPVLVRELATSSSASTSTSN